MNGLELSPSDPRHTSTVPLSFDVDQRLNIMHELRGLASELQENPFVQPSRSSTELKGVRLRSVTKNQPATTLSMKLFESTAEPSTASVSLTDSDTSIHGQRTYIHRPSINVWEEWLPGAPEASAFLSNPDFITRLEPSLPDSTLESLMDTPSQGMEVAHLLANFLKKKARVHHHYEHYKAHNNRVGDSEFTRDTDFVIDCVNTRVARSLFVAASFNVVDFGHIRRAYRYDLVDQNGYLESATGTLNVSGSTEIPKARLKALGLTDPITEPPTIALPVGVNDVRKAYSLAEHL